MKEKGFSLIEMAIVIFLVSLLLGGLLGPLSTQIDRQRVSTTEDALQTARDAIMGYVASNGYLPCPANVAVTDPTAANYGVEDRTPGVCATEGYIPWVTLGVSPVDAWGNPTRSNAADPFLGFIRYRVDRGFANTLPTPPAIQLGATPTQPCDALEIFNTAASRLTLDPGFGPGACPPSPPPVNLDLPIAVLYSTGPNQVPDLLNGNANSSDYTSGFRSSTPFYDDMTVWVSRPELFNHLIKAGQVP